MSLAKRVVVTLLDFF